MKSPIPLNLARTSQNQFKIDWSDGSTRVYNPRDIRLACPCASCIDEFTGEALLDPQTVPQNLQIERLQTVGRYALRFNFTDGHHTGLYTWPLLSQIGAIHS